MQDQAIMFLNVGTGWFGGVALNLHVKYVNIIRIVSIEVIGHVFCECQRCPIHSATCRSEDEVMIPLRGNSAPPVTLMW